MKNVAIVRRSYRLDGGAEKAVDNYLQALQNIGCSVTLICERWSGEPTSYHVIPIKLYGGRLTRLWQFWWRSQTILAAKKFDFVQTHEFICGCDSVRLGDGLHSQWLKKNGQNGSSIYRLASRLSLFHASKVFMEKLCLYSKSVRTIIVNSETVRAEVNESYPKTSHKVVLHRNVVPNLFYSSSRHSLKALKKLNQTKLLFVGSGWDRKGLEIVFEALSMVGPEYTLSIFGRDKNERRYKLLAQDLYVSHRVFFEGVRVITEEIYRDHDLTILPSVYDPFPNVIAESLVSGTKVCCSRATGGADYFDGSCVFPGDTPSEIVAAIMAAQVTPIMSLDQINFFRSEFSIASLESRLGEMID